MKGWSIFIGALALGAPAVAQAEDDDWTGFYVGAEAGAASGKLKATAADTCGVPTPTVGGDCVVQLSNVFVAGRGLVVVPGTLVAAAGSKTDWNLAYGGLIGGQFQTGSLILGLEGDYHGARDFAGFTTAVSLPATALAPASTGTVSRSARMSYDWSLRGRIGTAVGARAMIYASGGIAGTKVRLTGQDTFSTPAGAAAPGGGGAPTFVSPAIGPVVVTVAQQRQLHGWTAGAGGEVKLARNIGIGLDGRYTDFGTHTFALAGACPIGTAIVGTCAGSSRTAPPIVINGTTLNPATDVTPGIIPSTTRASFRDLRLTARVVFHF